MYSHTQNDNGTFNTRCLYCFMTVASAVETSEELIRLEAKHLCPEKALAQLLTRDKLAKIQAPAECKGSLPDLSTSHSSQGETIAGKRRPLTNQDRIQ